MAIRFRSLLLLSVLVACGAQAQTLPDLAGTQWRFPPSGLRGSDPLGNLVTFFADGTAEFGGLPNGPAKGRWMWGEDEVVFDCNGYTGYRVTIAGDQMTGTWRRLKGKDRGLSHLTSLARVILR